MSNYSWNCGLPGAGGDFLRYYAIYPISGGRRQGIISEPEGPVNSHPQQIWVRIIGWNPHHCFQFSLFPQTVFSAKSKSRSVQDVNRKTKVFSYRSTCFEVHSYYSLWDQDRNNSVTLISQFQSHSPLPQGYLKSPKLTYRYTVWATCLFPEVWGSMHMQAFEAVTWASSGSAAQRFPEFALVLWNSQVLLLSLSHRTKRIFPFIQHMYAVAV